MKPPTEGKTWTAQRKRKELDPAMDYLINAGVRDGLQCCRKVFHIHFDNAAAEDWREEKTKQMHGESHLTDLGPGLVMPNTVLDRIVACAHHCKIKTTDDLCKETHWSSTDCFGTEVVALVHHIILVPMPQAVLTTVPLQSRPVPSSNSAIIGSTRAHQLQKNKCGACGLEGHNRRNRVCLKHPSRISTTTGNKKNVLR
ncbi:hypothetical protein PAXINDRAFT_71362 [Paxillus involutus ATCC 200175]|nr:hypothetical protein PAXINDRAFT_71362 [Paxillus involutus ATCC 200175]